jgi:hypothetical protein
VTFEEYTRCIDWSLTVAGGGHARQHQLPGVAELVRRPRHTIDGLHMRVIAQIR